MDRKLEELAAEALRLGVESRAALAKTLLESLDQLSAEEHERLWVDEAADRYQALNEGQIEASSSAEVFARMEARSRSRSPASSSPLKTS
jgi:hypothetical protein